MYKRLISSILVFALLNLVGCYTYQRITKKDFLEASEYPDLKVQFQDKIDYYFDEGNYIVQSDSVYGTGKIKSKEGRRTVYEDFEGGISINDSEQIRIDKFDVLATILLIVGIAGLGAALGAAFEESLDKTFQGLTESK